MKSIGYVTTTVSLLVYAALMNGWALAKLWGWFIAPTFGAPLLPIPAAIGLYFTVAFFRPVNFTRSQKSWGAVLVEGVLAATLNPLVTLGCASIARLWL